MSLPFTLMIVTDDSDDVPARLARALSGPSLTHVCVQLRMKKSSRAEVLDVARQVRALTEERQVRLLINERVDVAMEVGAEGVHLPANGLSIATARALLPDDALIGVSCHTFEDVKRAERDHATYALLSPIRFVAGKAPALGVAGFAAIARQTSLPLLALGGVTHADVGPLRAAGAAGIALMRGVMRAEDPADALASFSAAW